MVGLPTETKLISISEELNGKIYSFNVFSDVVNTVKFINEHSFSIYKLITP